ncbi:protein FREE1-like [Coffea arabica]|uniref:Protein FREE1-like n=1 Tax=Coffea arabica TaxID=13443 RepID=A0A6P6TBS9_COFAR|nr:protein FREE1-like [Coffea arabica]XP_027078821.1 protein FREE1-like [Coffea arabica]
MSSSYYQYYQPDFQSPNPNPGPNPNVPVDSQFIPTPTIPSYAYASAPPVSSNYSPSADFSASNYSSSTYPPHSRSSDPAPSYSISPSPAASQPSNLPSYSFPHLETSYYPYDQNPGAAAASAAVSYDYPNSNPSYSPSYPYSSASYDGSSQNYDNSFGNNVSHGGYGDQGMYDAGVYKYNGGNSEPYGAKGTRSRLESGGVLFDDYGRPINVPGGKEQNGSGSFPKIVKAAPKPEELHDTRGSVQKYRVRLLSEGASQSDMDVLCQIGLDGIRILDPATSRTLKIYPLEGVTRWDVLDSYIFAFWAKSSVDIEPRRIRLKSNSYTTNNILDTVAAASIQVKEMGGTTKPSDAVKDADQPAERKKAFIDWMNLMKLGHEEKDHWVPDEAVNKCTACSSIFNAFNRKHHCRNCGDIFCDKCTQGRIALTADENAQPVRVCDRCLAEVTQRLSNTREAAARFVGAQSHEELVRKLKEEMDKNRKTSSDVASDGFGTRTREVACPTCTVHLQVQVPASGSETIECSVCQHPFLVGAH